MLMLMASADVLRLLEALRAPLLFASKDEFKNLSRVQKLEHTLAQMAGSHPYFARFLLLTREIDNASMELKKNTILKLLKELEHLSKHLQQDVLPKSTPAVVSLPKAKLKKETASLLCINKDTPVSDLKGVGPQIQEALHQKGIFTAQDLFYFLPRRYEDQRLLCTIAQAPLGQTVTVVGIVRLMRDQKTRSAQRMCEMIIADDSSVLCLKWFRLNVAHFQRFAAVGQRVKVTGVVEQYQHQKQMIHPDLKVLAEDQTTHVPQIVPVYSEIAGIKSFMLKRLIAQHLSTVTDWPDDFPYALAAKLYDSLPNISESLHCLHQPQVSADIRLLESGRSLWHERLLLEELLVLQLVFMRERQHHAQLNGVAIKIDNNLCAQAQALFPFTLTAAQQRVISDIVQVLMQPRPMHRLVQGDVGCGKTAIAMLAAFFVMSRGYQAVLMAPTEILAAQHYEKACAIFGPIGHAVVLLSASMSLPQKRDALQKIADGRAKFIVGTQALIQDKVQFYHLALAMVDEQHRFGVLQRAALMKKARADEVPHVLVLSATPIPRTLALTVYGDLDVSIIDELPPGRTAIKTHLLRDKQRPALEQHLRKQLQAGRQVYVVYPLVEESEKLDLKDATNMHVSLSLLFSEYRVALLTGRTQSDEKDRIMAAFSRGEIHILVSTTVIEVGVDVPNASVMVIEHAERYGLSQLHQLRGRVGRGAYQSYCFLMAAYTNDVAYHRLSLLCETQDGFKIAEEDLKIRGAGDFIGTRQSGIPELGLVSLVRDQDLLIVAKKMAVQMIQDDASLKSYPHLSARLHARLNQVEKFTHSG